MSPSSRVAIVIPARDEQAALPLVLEEIPRALDPRVVVVDNGSRDATAAVAARHGAEVVHEPVAGYGRACQAGIRHLRRDPPEVLVILDADHSDYPEEMPMLVEPILSGQADMVLGSRLEQAAPGVLPPQVRWGNALATGLIRLLWGHRYRDMGPFRALAWDAVQRMDLRDPAYGWNAEMQCKALREGLRVREVPVRYRARTGTSKISGTLRGTIGAGRGILGTIIALRFFPGWYARRVSRRSAEPAAARPSGDRNRTGRT